MLGSGKGDRVVVGRAVRCWLGMGLCGGHVGMMRLLLLGSIVAAYWRNTIRDNLVDGL